MHKTRQGGFSCFLLYISFLVFSYEKDILEVGYYYAQHVYFFFMLAGILYGARNFSLESLNFSKYIFYLFLLIFVQSIASLLWWNAADRSGISYIAASTSKIFIFYFIYLFLYLNIRGGGNLYCLIKGGFLSLTFTFLIFSLQMASIYGGGYFEDLNNKLAVFYEARLAPLGNMGNVHIFYSEGSYAATQHRVSGLTREAPMFAGMVSMFYLPFLLAGLGAGREYISNIVKIKWIYWFLAMCCVMLIFSTSLSAALFLAVAGAVFLARKRSGKLAIASIVFALLLTVTLWMAGIINLKFNAFDVFQERSVSESVSSATRAGTTIAAFYAFLDSPVFGYGASYREKVYQYLPLWARTYESEDYHDGEVTIFNIFLSVATQFGGGIAVLLFYWLYRLWREYKKIFLLSPSAESAFWKAAYGYYLLLFIVATMTMGVYTHSFIIFMIPMFAVVAKKLRESFSVL